MIDENRYKWIDYIKGLTILMVVNMHVYNSYVKYIDCSTAIGYFVEWAQLFRMPLFFIVAGLFATRSLTLKLTDFIDKKVLHFAYFYLLWLSIYAVIRSQGNLTTGIEYFTFNLTNTNSTLWFIYILAIFFITFRLLKNISLLLILPVAFLLNLTHLKTGNILVDEFAHRWVWFLIGAYFSRYILDKVRTTKISFRYSIVNLLCFAVVTLFAFKAKFIITHNHLAAETIYDITNGIITFGLVLWGVVSVILIIKHIADRNLFEFLRVCGQKSMQIYLAFFIFMLPTLLLIGTAISKTGYSDLLVLNDILIISITLFAVFGAIYLDKLVNNVRIFMPFQFIFVRPKWAQLGAWSNKTTHKNTLAPAE